MENINHTYFEGIYQEIWKTVVPDEFTKKEVEFLIRYFNLDSSSRVADLMCGHGRHTIRLAEQNIHVFAVDNLPNYVQDIAMIAAKDSLPVTVVKENIELVVFEEDLDLALWMGNSMNFFNKQSCITILKNLHRSMRVGSHIIINSWSLLEMVANSYEKKGWSEHGDFLIFSSSKVLLQPTRLETQTIMQRKDGIREHKIAIDYLFSFSEVEEMLLVSGFKMVEAFSIPGKRKYEFGDSKVYFIGERLN